MFVFQKMEQKYPWNFAENNRLHPAHIWDEPGFAMKGVLGLGFHTDGEDAVGMEVCLNGKKLDFHAVRNLWTPAYMDTYYRSEAFGKYRRSGLLIIRERKCITREDVFVSEITVINDDREEVELEFRLTTTFERQDGNFFRVDLHTVPEGLIESSPICGEFGIICDEGTVFSRRVKAFSDSTFRYGAVYTVQDRKEALKRAEAALSQPDIFKACEERFNQWFEDYVPKLETEDPEILKTYYYRWYVVYKNTCAPEKVIPDHSVEGNAIYESIAGDWYGCPIGLSVGMQVEEAKWLRDGKLAGEQLDNWIKGSGCYQGYIQFTPLAAWHLYEKDPDREWLESSYEAFKNFTFSRLDSDIPQQMPVCGGSWPTGAEYQPGFYQHTPAPWDWQNDIEMAEKTGKEVWPLYRLDEIVFTIGNVRACEQMAEELGREEEKEMFSRYRREMLSVLKERFWNEERGLFLDVDVKTGRQCDQAAGYDSFTPFMWDMISGEEYERGIRKILEEKLFWGNFPITTVEKTCPMFWPDNCITGPWEADKENPHVYGCCWNGPVWPFADTLALTALGDVARRRKEYRRPWLLFFKKYTEMHFLCGDYSVPDIVEHYRYSDGTPFSSTHDYFHSEYIDLLMKYWAGIRIERGRPANFDPFTEEEFSIGKVEVNGIMYRFRQYYAEGKLFRQIETEDYVLQP